MKGFLDRVLMPGFAFEEHEDGTGWSKLLTGKSAHLLTTMDTPTWVYRWIYKSPGLKAIARATLGFCGIAPVRTTIFGAVKDSDSATRCGSSGAGPRIAVAGGRADGRRTPARGGRQLDRRAAAAIPSDGLGRLCHRGGWRGAGEREARLWLVAGAVLSFPPRSVTVFTNEYFDLESDRRNKNFGPFTGGSRVLVDGRISPADETRYRFGDDGLRRRLSRRGARDRFSVDRAVAILAIGYTTPPFKLCWRGLGEPT